MSELFVIVGLHARPGTEDQLREDLRALVEPSRREAGNISYDLYEDAHAPGRFVFIERWESADAQQRHHNQGEHILHFHANGDRNVEARDYIQVLNPVA